MSHTMSAGLAISADRVVYLADGTNIRTINANGIINTLIGHHGHKSVWRPIPCSGSLPLPEVSQPGRYRTLGPGLADRITGSRARVTGRQT